MAYLYKKETKIPFYRGMFVIMFSDSSDKIKKFLPEYNNEDVYAHTWRVNWKGMEGFIIILNFENSYRKITHGTIAHEATHAANMIAKERGFQPDFNNDEPLAYLTEWIVDEIYRLMEKHNKKAA